ncbi:MAG: carboxypeptidase regulatory-like domain-containing protein [Acidobacteriota bacterium]|nr:carboxypeptidase regulatory-like domain-containing protein [Acidobacteriota bacterium]
MAAILVAGTLAVAAAAQSMGRISGSVKDENGNPWPGVTVVIHSDDTGATFNVTTDAKGQYSQMGVAAGIYTITFQTDKFAPQVFRVRVEGGGTLTQDVDFKALIAKNPQYAEAVKKQEAAKQKFTELKVHFAAGRKALSQIDALRQQMGSQPAAQQEQSKQQIAQLSQTAVTELSAAQKIAGPKDSNLPTIVGNLALAYEAAGKHAEAADSFTQAAQLDPTNPNYLLGAATNLAYGGKLQDASADCEKVAALAAPTGATCWRNIGVVLYNTNQLKDAVVPLQKATQADPTNADNWFLLGNALMNTMQSKMVDGKLTAIVNPGTVEAYQKYLQLAPNGPQAEQAKQTLQVLQQLGAGVDTKFIAPPKKKH